MDLSDFHAKFPLLCPTGLFTLPQAFHGFITIGGIDHEVHLKTPQFPALRGLTLSTDTRLSCLVNSCRTQLQEEEAKCNTILEYLIKFQQICSSRSKEEHEAGDLSLFHDSFFKYLLLHLEDVGWSKVTEISSDFSAVSLETRDEKGRCHTLKVKVGAGYPHEEPTVEADLPIDLKFSWNSVAGLSCIIGAWEKELKKLQQFWDVMDELDESVLVLEPQSPARRHITRRILLSNHVSVQITVSVNHPRSLPQCHLLGSSRLTVPLNALLTDKYEEWNPEHSIMSNLEAILDVNIVKSKAAGTAREAEEWGVECAVCYCLHLEDKLPDLICDHCSQAFHVSCLYEWLRGLTNSRQSMNVIFGECPYCTQLISCKMPA